MAKGQEDDAVERAAEVREQAARTLREVRRKRAAGGVASDALDDAEAPEPAVPGAEKQRGGVGSDLNALLERTRSVIERTRRVIEETKSSLTRGGSGADDGKAGGKGGDGAA